MSRSRFRRLGVEGRAAVTLQWLWRMVAGVIAIEVIQHVVAPTLGVSILSLSQVIDRVRLPTTPVETVMETGTIPAATVGDPSPSLDLLVSLVVWDMALFASFAAFCTLWFGLDYLIGGSQYRAVATNHDGDS
jgi:hypothetical protein